MVDAENKIPENSYKNDEVVYPTLPEGVDAVGLGNHVMIDRGNGEFSVLVHMRRGSVTVRKGEHIIQGQRIGAIGFSGDTFLPHLYYMLMDGMDMRNQQRIAIIFQRF